MCGIAGFWKQPMASEQALTQWGDAMNSTLRHRTSPVSQALLPRVDPL
jgi:hypothetical protein